jgi:hypothetical protein
MKEIIKEYQHIMGWNDQSIINILCDYIEAVTDAIARVDATVTVVNLQEFLERRAKEEEEMGVV